jgi:16S rRNA (uracil1498-N3)-methyltransferase
MSERFYSPGLFDNPTVQLEGSEAHHLLHVLRLTVGDDVELFNGEGGAAAAEITAVSRSSVELQIQPRRESAKIVKRTVDLATAVPKSDRFRWLVEKATELGIGRLLPLQTSRSVVHPSDGKLQKMRQTVIAACKQSGRNRLMTIEPIFSWNSLIAEEFSGKSVIVAHPTGEPLLPLLAASDVDRQLLLVIGPEGGLSDEEVEQATSAGVILANLGDNILRIETAALALAAICLNAPPKPTGRAAGD